MAAGDPYQMRVTSTFLGQSIENVFWFYQNTNGSAPNPISGLITAFIGLFIQPIENYQNEEYSWDSIEVQNWQTVTQAGSALTAGEVGLVAGTPMPSWVNYTISWNRLGAGYNYPMKRISGVDETMTDGNDVAGAAATAIAAIANDIISFNTAQGANFALMAYGNPPPLGAANQLNPIYRPQFPTAVRGVKLGTQKTRKP